VVLFSEMNFKMSVFSTIFILVTFIGKYNGVKSNCGLEELSLKITYSIVTLHCFILIIPLFLFFYRHLVLNNFERL